MEVSKVQPQRPVNFNASSKEEKSAVLQKKFVKPDNDNTKAIALSLAALAAAGAAFELAKIAQKQKKLLKKSLKKHPKQLMTPWEK